MLHADVRPGAVSATTAPSAAGWLTAHCDVVIFTRALDGFPLERSRAAIAEHEEILDAFHGSSRERVRKAAIANVTRGRDSIIAYLRAASLEATPIG